MKNRFSTFITRILAVVICACFISLCLCTTVEAKSPSDEILDYEITADVDKDTAHVILNYHIEWKVLESDSAGPLTWMKIGIPNSHVIKYEAKSDTIKKLSKMTSGGYYARVDLKKKYYAGDVVTVDFCLEMDYMYDMNSKREGFTEFSFTPGWFNDIKVDQLVIRWNMDMVDSFSPYCAMEDGYLVWATKLDKGQRFTVNVSYPNDSMEFSAAASYLRDYVTNSISSTKKRAKDSESGQSIFAFISVFFMGFASLLVKLFIGIVKYIRYACLGGEKKTITRTKVVYFNSCPGCGAGRTDGQTTCEYCGRSLIKSEETLKEEDIKQTDKKIMKFREDGEFHYSADPNVYIRVHTHRSSIPRPSISLSSSRGGRGGCAHSSCACACACACAGGGRAGCTNKDFYNTNLKLSQIKKKSTINSDKKR